MAAPDFKSAASLTPTVLVSAAVATSETTIYTVGSGHGLKISTGTLCNTSGAAINVSLSLVPSGGTAGTTNRVVAAYSLAAGDTLSLRDYLSGALMGPGDFISVLASDDGVSLVLTGAVAA